MLKTLWTGNHGGVLNTSPRKASRGWGKAAELAKCPGVGRQPDALSALDVAGMMPPLAVIASRLQVPPIATIQVPGRPVVEDGEQRGEAVGREVCAFAPCAHVGENGDHDYLHGQGQPYEPGMTQPELSEAAQIAARQQCVHQHEQQARVQDDHRLVASRSVPRRAGVVGSPRDQTRVRLLQDTKSSAGAGRRMR